MAFRYYKRVNLGGGFHLNFSKTGVGVSAGVPGARYSVHSSGRTVKTVGIPGTGMYYRKDTYAPGSGSRSSGSRAMVTPPSVQMYPRAGFLAPKDEKEFVKGVTAYMQGRHAEALEHLQASSARDVTGRHVGEEFFEAMAFIGLGKLAEAQKPFETVIASEEPIPDALMRKYKIGGAVHVQVTPFLLAELPMNHVAAVLLLAEVYQHTGQEQKAIELLESAGSVAGLPLFALSLAELYDGRSEVDDLLRVTEDFTTNEDDVTTHLLIYRADGLSEKKLYDAALTTLKEAMRFRSRSPALLHLARYVRAAAYDAMGRKAQAKKDLERIYAEDPHFGNGAVAEKLGLSRRQSAPAAPEGGIEFPPPPSG